MKASTAVTVLTWMDRLRIPEPCQRRVVAWMLRRIKVDVRTPNGVMRRSDD